MEAKLEVNPDFNEKINFSDEAHLWMNGVINKQNCQFWGYENTLEIHERDLHPPKIIVWCGFCYGRIIGPYFFLDERGEALTVNRPHYDKGLFRLEVEVRI